MAPVMSMPMPGSMLGCARRRNDLHRQVQLARPARCSRLFFETGARATQHQHAALDQAESRCRSDRQAARTARGWPAAGRAAPDRAVHVLAVRCPRE